MTPFNSPVAIAPGAKAVQNRPPAEKSLPSSSAERFKEYLHRAVKADRQDDVQQDAQRTETLHDRIREESMTAKRSTETDRVAETDRTRVQQQQAARDNARPESPTDAKSMTSAKDAKGAAGSEGSTKGEATKGEKTARNAPLPEMPGVAAAPLFVPTVAQFGVPQGVPNPALGGAVPGGLAGAGGDPAKLEALLLEALGARQGGGPMGEVKVTQVGNLTLPVVGGAVAATAGNNTGFEIPAGMTAAVDAGKIGAAGMKADGPTPHLTLTATKPDFAQDMADSIGRLRMISRPGMPEQVRITLDPQDLGELHVRLQMDKNQQVHVTIMAETDAAKELLNRDLPQLRDAFARQDLGFGGLTVNVGTNARQGSDERWRDGARQGSAKEQDGKNVPALDPLALRSAQKAYTSGDTNLNLFA
ncbi:MAG: flagellar hook-length control protein FliK [Magnetococcales bacterium]|nr:flagellar hook-length control protein FliK [Magnetococcales bacterium]